MKEMWCGSVAVPFSKGTQLVLTGHEEVPNAILALLRKGERAATAEVPSERANTPLVFSSSEVRATKMNPILFKLIVRAYAHQSWNHT